MKYIQIKNWEKFQQYKDRRPTWIKLLVEIIEEFDADGNPKKFYSLPDSAKLTFILLACLRANFNEKIPYPNDRWLRKRLGIRKLNLQPLVDTGFIIIDTESVQNCTEMVRQRQSKRERQRERTETEKDRYLDFVFLTKDEYSKLVEKFGKAATDEKIETLNEGIGSKGYKYKSHYFTILSWDRKEKRDSKANTAKTKLFPIRGKNCRCGMPAVYKDDSGDYDHHYCYEHMPEKVKEKYTV